MTTPPSPSEDLPIPLPRFNGDKEEFNSFMTDLTHFLSMQSGPNSNTDKYKIILTLSFMNEGVAASWKQLFILEKRQIQAQNPGSELSYGTWDAFKARLEDEFAPNPIDVYREAIAVLSGMRQGTKAAAAHIRDFKAVYARTGMGMDSDKYGIHLFQKTLEMWILKKILTRSAVPQTLEGWYEASEKLDSGYRTWLRITGGRE